MITEKNNTLYKLGVAPIRHTNDPVFGDHDWIDVGKYSSNIEWVISNVNKNDTYIPGWAKTNPVVRYSRVIVIEVVPGMTLDIRTPRKLGTERITIEG